MAAETVDMTLPVSRKPLGARHPLPKLMEDVEDFFISMGWQISSGPEIEAEWYNFDSLNFGPDHPARQMQDTFYVKGNQAKDAAGFVGSNMVVRTQTSSDQVRALLTRGVRCTSRPRAACSAPMSWTPSILRCSTSAKPSPSTRHDHGRPEGRAGQARRRHVRP